MTRTEAIANAWNAAEIEATRSGTLPALWASLKASREAERGNPGDFSLTLDQRAKARALGL